MVALLRHISLGLASGVTVLTEESLGTLFIALITDPAGRAVTLSSSLITGRVILALTLEVAIWSEETSGTLGFTGNSYGNII